MKRLLTISLFLTLTLSLSGRAFTTIKGHLNHANGYQVRLLTWSDQISYMEKKLASAVIDSAGNFNLITELQTTTFAFFYIGNIRADIILEPGRAYTLKFDDYPPVSYLETRNLLLQKETIGYTILNQSADDPNIAVANASAMYNKFLAKHYMDLYLKRHAVVDAFIDSFFLAFGSDNHPFVRQMVDFRIAGLKLTGYKVNLEQAHAAWLKEVDFDYSHPDFMEFFNQLFSNYLTTRLKHYDFSELKNIINVQGSYFALSEMMGRDSVLRNELLREAVMIKGLGELYHHRDFNEQQVLKILQHIAYSSKFREHRTAASNLIFLNTRFNKGMMAPDFQLPDRFGTPYSLSKSRGRYLYVAFFASDCVPCLSELTLLASQYPVLKDHLDIMVISLDPDTSKLWRIVEQHRFPWPVLHFNNEFELTDRYQIRNYPFFMLIAPDGTFETYSARLPSNLFKVWFEETILKKR
jgi:peroxiredoxin